MAKVLRLYGHLSVAEPPGPPECPGGGGFLHRRLGLWRLRDGALFVDAPPPAALHGTGAEHRGAGTSDVPREVFEDVATSFPRVTMAAITSTGDKMQVRFYNAVCMANMLPERLTAEGFHARLLERLEAYNRHPNFVTFLISGESNYFLPLKAYFSTEVEGIPLPRWLDDLPEGPGQSISSRCHGSCWKLAKTWSLSRPPISASEDLPTDVAPHGEDDPLIKIAAPAPSLPWWSNSYYAALVLTSLLLCAGAARERRKPAVTSFASRVLSQESDSE
ncbi:unnamed protein product [Effrenium voratum]|nr:unnamed protein product [Effrenium voratum]